MNRRVLLVGAGGHAKVVADALSALGWSISAYVDPKEQRWIDAQRYDSDDAAIGERTADAVTVGIGGTSPAGLQFRHDLLLRYVNDRRTLPAICDPRAIVSSKATLSGGCQVLAGAMINADAQVGKAVIVNTRAVVEHDAVVGHGSHVAPGAIVLGGASVGSYCMIGAGAMVLPGARVPDRTLVPALSVYAKSQ